MKVHTYHCERCGSDYSFLEAHPNRRRCPECKNVLSILTEKRDVSPGVTWHVQLADGDRHVDTEETVKLGASWPEACHWGVRTA